MYGAAAAWAHLGVGTADNMYMSAQAAAVQGSDRMRLLRFLPLSIAVTVAVTVLPLIAVAHLGPARSVPAVALHVLAAVAISIVVARILAALWTRHGSSSDLVFGDLLLWGWTRRALAERRLEAASRRLVEPDPGGGDRGALLRRMSELLEARDPYTHGHSRRVARHAERTAREMGLSREQIEQIRAAALVHDIGKINVPRAVLTKPDRLTDQEFALIKRHPGDGAAMVADLGDAQLTAIVRHHHERIDGTGYPDRLAGEDIPLGARVIAVVDTFDAITSTRAYRKPRTHKQALAVLQREAGTQLDPVAVAAFVSYYSAGRSVGVATAFATAPQRFVSGLGGVQSGLAASVAPIAQTACGVGGVALIGACLSGPLLPADTTPADSGRTGAERQVAARPGPAAREPAPSAQRGDRSVRRDANRAAGPGGGISDSAPVETNAPRALRTPGSDPPGASGGQGGSGGGGGGGGGGTTPPAVDAPSVLSDVQTVLEPVTSQLPPVQTPVPLPAPLPPTGLP